MPNAPLDINNNMSTSTTATTIKIESSISTKEDDIYYHDKSVEQKIDHNEDTGVKIEDMTDLSSSSSSSTSVSSYAEDDKRSVESYYSTDDGGYGWVIVLGAFLGMFTIYGATNCW
ncbi:hypothetical protein INT45_013242 [Circinella minor]|uniref:Uncharacterized protein n=1 Tax=Circinella minor TaxID=1195481 RepID=A0A8H7S3A9_9FUNG|nr:hypothetical protein INT45_013242 [Circinella minor]